MLSKLRLRQKTQTVMGHRLKEPRFTVMAVIWVLIYAVLPVLAIGSLLDLLVQQVTGQCIGFWCWF
jgi:fatty acid desaturase